jgi:hypothetical protein
MKKYFVALSLLMAFCTIRSQTLLLNEDFNLTYSYLFSLYNGTQAQAYYDNGAAILTGGTDTLWTGTGNNTTAQNAWNDNTEHRASVSTNFDATSYSSLELKIRMRQIAGSSLKYSWFRVLINGIQISDECGESNFNPLTFSSDIFKTLTFNLSSYAGSQFYLSLQSSCKMFGTDAVLIDNVTIYSTNLNTSATIPYTQNFETYDLPSGWTTCQSANSFGWQTGTAISTAIPPHTGYVASVNYPSDGIDCNNYLISPVFNFYGQTDILLQFDVFTSNGCTITGSLNGSMNWTENIYSIPFAMVWQTISVPLTGYSNQTGFRFAFHHSDFSNGSSQLAIDNVYITGTAVAMPDAGITAIISPVSGFNLSGSEAVSVQVHNFGNQAISNFPVYYKINNNNPVSQNYTASLASGQTTVFTFSTTANLSAYGNYIVKTWTGLLYDVNHSNDTLVSTVNCSEPAISSFPYYASFESSPQWTAGGSNSSWEWGIPSDAFISSASGSQKAWVTNLDGPYNAFETSYVTSPNFDFSQMLQPIVKIDVLCQTETIEDGACLEYSTDHGNTWQHVGTSGEGLNWYNSPWVTALYFTGATSGWNGVPFSQWTIAQHSVGFLGGQSSVKFRVFFGSTENTNQKEGFAFDNFLIYDTPAYDIGVTSVLNPVNDCVLTNSEHVKVRIFNSGIYAVSNFTVSYKLNGGQIHSQVINSTLNSQSYIDFTFADSVNMSLPGTYQIKSWTSLGNDQVIYNDTIVFTAILTASVLLPFTENFQGGVLPYGWLRSQAEDSDGWIIGSNQTSSYFTPPPHTIYASSNDDACNCDMSYDLLITPHLNFSGYNNITLNFDAFNPGNYGSSGHVMVSTDCATTWTNIYDVPSNTTSWQSLTVSLNNYAGYQNIKIAFHHDDGGEWGSGFAVDNVLVTGSVTPVTQNINLPVGWSLFSTYINTTELVSVLLVPVLSNLIIVKNDIGNVYWPQYGVNSIGNAIVGDAYQIKMNGSAILTVTGLPVVPQLTPVYLTAGWHLLGYLRQSPADITNIFNTIINDVGIVKNGAGQVYWPYYGINQIVTMNPGEGYLIRLWNANTITYPAN